jgi:hypothetical protein
MAERKELTMEENDAPADASTDARRAEAKDIKTSTARLLELLTDKGEWVRVYVAAHSNLPVEQIEAPAGHRDRWIRAFAARNPKAPEAILVFTPSISKCWRHRSKTRTAGFDSLAGGTVQKSDASA